MNKANKPGSRANYRAALRRAPSPFARRGPFLGTWAPAPDLPPERLAQGIAEACAAPGARVLKEDRCVRVIQASLWGRDVVIKTRLPAGGGERLRYLFRPSRARRAWAAGCVLADLGIPAAEPLGFLEEYKHGLPARWDHLSTFHADSEDAASWIRRNYSGLPAEARAGCWRALAEAIFQLYRKGLYHGDTKASNILRRETDRGVRWAWIDLEALRCSAPAGRRAVLRNLVQCNGSLYAWLPADERRGLLEAAARYRPWLAGPGVWRSVEQWTERRIRREKRLGIGP